LLDHLLPAGLEARLVRSCRDIIGVNEPRARLMLDAHEVLLRFAMRHHLLSEPDSARSRQNLDRLKQQLKKVAGG
jgi:type II secretory pathway component PulM